MVCLLSVGFDGSDGEAEPKFTNDDRFGVYRIDRREDGTLWELGRGAMGVTYRALDTSLRRPVALKLIDGEWAKRGAEARERFMREARMAAALRHPNVATVHHFGVREENGQCFCAMELVEGETLEARVRRTGPLDALTVVEIALQVTSALAAAAKQGLVHRDLKPANLMILRGEDEEAAPGKVEQASSLPTRSAERPQREAGFATRQFAAWLKKPRSFSPTAAQLTVKVIDFGVAKALSEKTDVMALTQHGFIGTPAFASPEQFDHSPIDVRSDIYSLGATLWYLLTGQMPFPGGSVEQIRARQQAFVPPVTQLKAARVPRSLTSTVVSMLALQSAARPGIRDLAARLQRCRAELLDHWRTARRVAFAAAFVVVPVLTAAILLSQRTDRPRPLTAVTTTIPDKSIAVLPFENLSDNDANAYFADGIQDQILTTLAKVADLKVISRTSVMQFREPQKRNLREIAQQLGVAHLLEGSVQRAANRVRVSAQLIDARTDAHIWAEQYESDMADVLSIQSDIAQKIAGQLEAALSADEAAALRVRDRRDPAAYELYLQAQELHRHGGAGGVMGRKALAEVALLEEAVARDPTFVPALCMLAQANLQAYWFSEDHTPERLERARKALEAAARLEADSGEVHVTRGLFHYLGERAYAAALAELELAASKMPNDTSVLFHIAAIQRRDGRWEESIGNMKRALALDPRNGQFTLGLSWTYRRLGRYPDARRTVDAFLAWKNDDLGFQLLRTEIALEEKGDLAPMRELLEHGLRPGADRDLVLTYRLLLAYFGRDYRAGEKVLAEHGPWDMTHGFNTPREYLEGVFARALGEPDRAAAAFSRARQRAAAAVGARADDAKALMVLAKIDAKLGRRDEAIREAERAVEMLPVSLDTYDGPVMLVRLAQVCAEVGEVDRAIEVLQGATALPAGLGYGILQLDGEFDRLRHDARFQKIIASAAPGQSR